MADERKIYCGSGRIVNAWKRGISICLEDIPQEWKKQGKNGKTYVNLEVSDLKEPNKWGKTVSVEVNQWTPGQTQSTKASGLTQQANQRRQERDNTPENFIGDDLDSQIPF